MQSPVPLPSSREQWLERIRQARERLRGRAHATPVMTSRSLNALAGAPIVLKCENFQRVGAFKFRGAFNAMAQLTDHEKRRGVLTYSSGNHAQAVALAGQLLGIQTVVVMPSNAPTIKRAATEAYGARVIAYDPASEVRETVAHQLQARHDYVLIPPFDHPEIVAGQATAAWELAEQAPGLQNLLVPCGGGGLLSGSALAMKSLNPQCRLFGVEPAMADDAARSFKTRQLQTIESPQTIADGTRTRSLGEITFPLVLEHVDDIVTVPEEAIIEAVQFLFYRVKIVVEPSGALGIAALMSGAIRPAGPTGVILSGGNVDGPAMAEILLRS